MTLAEQLIEKVITEATYAVGDYVRAIQNWNEYKISKHDWFKVTKVSGRKYLLKRPDGSTLEVEDAHLFLSSSTSSKPPRGLDFK